MPMSPAGGGPASEMVPSLAGQPISNFGTQVTASATPNTYGSYAEIIETAADWYGFYMVCTAMNHGGAQANTLITLGKDESGGTSYSDWITDILTGPAGDANQPHSSGVWFYFPLFVPSGTAIAAKRACQRASDTGRIRLYGQSKPDYPETWWLGGKVETVGANTADSGGVDVVPGTTSEGSWTSIGTTSNDWRFVQVGIGQKDSITSGAQYELDLSYGTTGGDRILGTPVYFHFGISEEVHKLPHVMGFYADIPSGSTIYARAQTSSTATDELDVAVYGVY